MTRGSDEPSDQPKREFRWITSYAQQIADAANRWAYLEYYINKSIWALADVKPAIGACMTSQMYTLNAKLSALLSLLKLRKASEELIVRVNRFSSGVRDALDARNRLVHDIWLTDELNKSEMGKLRITSDKKLEFKIESVSLVKLTQDVQVIERRRLEAGEIAAAIESALPSLPDIPQAELYPITETPTVP
jgi:hypothetical protein